LERTAQAIDVLQRNSAVQHGIFGAIRFSGLFPPRMLLNDFLAQGQDLCDQDARMERWPPFILSEVEYSIVKSWWITRHPEAREDALDTSSWSEWSTAMLERLNAD
jgi:hypothetical protein